MFFFQPHYDVYLVKKQKTLNVGKITEYDEQKIFFPRKKRFIFQNFKIESLPNWEGAKFAGASWPSCL